MEVFFIFIYYLNLVDMEWFWVPVICQYAAVTFQLMDESRSCSGMCQPDWLSTFLAIWSAAVMIIMVILFIMKIGMSPSVFYYLYHLGFKRIC